jgi:hypothetical protein
VVQHSSHAPASPPWRLHRQFQHALVMHQHATMAPPYRAARYQHWASATSIATLALLPTGSLLTALAMHQHSPWRLPIWQFHSTGYAPARYLGASHLAAQAQHWLCISIATWRLPSGSSASALAMTSTPPGASLPGQLKHSTKAPKRYLAPYHAL